MLELRDRFLKLCQKSLQSFGERSLFACQRSDLLLVCFPSS